VKATHHIALASRFVLALALGGVATPLVADAQRTISRDPKADAILVVTFRSADRGLGTKAAEELRDALPKEIPRKTLWPIPTGDVKANLEPAGFPYDQPITTNDARLLAVTFRADEFIEGRVENNGGTYRVNARMVSTNDAKMTQPLPQVEGRRLDHAMAQVAEHIKAARAMLPHERRCEGLVRDRKFQEAATAARQAIAAYQPSTWGRICLASAYQGLEMPPDSILPLAQQVLALDSLNYHALAMAAGAYKTMGDNARSTELLVKLLSTDPTNVTLQTAVVEALAASRNFARARQIIDDAVAAQPGDPDLIRLQFRILTATENWKDAIASGENLIRTDTSATDTTFFPVLASAYKADSQPQKAAEAIARGLAKYPQNAKLHLLHSQFLREAGQLPQSIVAARRALQINPNMPEANIAFLTVAQTFIDLQQFDSVSSVLRVAATAAKSAADSTRVSQFALQQGQREFNLAKADTTEAGAVAAREGFDRSIRWFALADSISPSPAAKFQIGYAAFLAATSVANKEIVPGSKNKTLNNEQICTLGRLGQQYSNTAQIQIRAGGQTSPEAAAQIMNAAMGQGSYWDQVIKASCKGATGASATRTPR
jgi:tetratricopeptide (TPR) repeat protein